MARINEILRSTFLFKNLHSREIGLLTRIAEVRRFGAGSYVVREGERGECLYLIREGGVNITKGAGNSFLSYLGPGGYFGEMSLFEEHAVRSANVVAASDVSLVAIEKEKFWPLLEKHPKMANKIYREIVLTLIERLTVTSADLAMMMKGQVASQEDISKITAAGR